MRLCVMSLVLAALVLAPTAAADHGTGEHWPTSDWPALVPPPSCPLQRTLLVRDQTGFNLLNPQSIAGWNTWVLTALGRWTTATTTVDGCPRYKFIRGAGAITTCNQMSLEPGGPYFPNTIRLCRHEPDVPPGADWDRAGLHIMGCRIGVPATINWGNPTWIRDMLTHEFGHCLGLLHSKIGPSVMFNPASHFPGTHDIELLLASTNHVDTP